MKKVKSAKQLPKDWGALKFLKKGRLKRIVRGGKINSHYLTRHDVTKMCAPRGDAAIDAFDHDLGAMMNDYD